MHIVERSDSHDGTKFQDINPKLVEPVFLSRKTLASLSKTEAAGIIIDYMAHQTVRSPSDLQYHLSRIDAHHQIGDSEGLYAALLDLFIVLQGKGLPLRKRLLEKFHTRLKSQHRSALSTLLSGKSNEDSNVPFARGSMLSHGRTGVGRLLVKQNLARNTQSRDPVEDARDLINSDQIDRAQTLLKKAFQANPQRQDIGWELMAIYRHSKNFQAVKNILQGSKNITLALRKEWEDLYISLKGETN